MILRILPLLVLTAFGKSDSGPTCSINGIPVPGLSESKHQEVAPGVGLEGLRADAAVGAATCPSLHAHFSKVGEGAHSA